MAFDQTTRNRLQRFVTDARTLLSDEFTRQLQNEFGLNPETGEVSKLSNLNFLDDAGRETAGILRETMEHYLATTPGSGKKEVLSRIVREQAFTILNRMAALRMAEARGILMESIGKGYQSQGFQLYSYMAGSALGESGDAYRHYIFSIFDEFSLDLKVLFDRFSPQGRLFPKESKLLELLDLINHPDIEKLWAEDETIGWIYQYFNSKEERKKMRDASQAPRNSRELAVRNQFFTPRYVVEFLTDNTLGRLWVDALGDKTSLRHRCRYLMVKHDENLEGSGNPRDPRTLRLLDPACGSMHFGLYAFDLFLDIYHEAWEWEQEHGAGSLNISTSSDQGLKPLCKTYANRHDYLLDVPKLIIEHNIYGVDIDPRAAQIASLALWLRAQRAWHDADVKAQNRPLIGQGNVVPAVAPPRESELRDQFINNLDDLDAELFDQTLTLLDRMPEQGIILKAETELPRLIKKIFGEHGGLFKQEDIQQWESAEKRLRKALRTFSTAGLSSYQGHLYAEDALQGLRLIDLCNEKFDVVLMNPPFGALAANSKQPLSKAYPCSKNDLLAIFVERGLALLRSGGRIGAITSRTCFFLSSFQKWREQVVLGTGKPEVMADLGYGVMDDAMVEAAAYVLVKQSDKTAAKTDDQPPVKTSVKTSFLRLLANKDKAENLPASCDAFRYGKDGNRVFQVASDSFLAVPGAPFAYWVSDSVRAVFEKFPAFESEKRTASQGLATAEDFRFVRTWWEQSGKGWKDFAKGGAYSPFYSDVYLTVNWKYEGKEIRNLFDKRSGKLLSRPQNTALYLRPGLTWPLRTTSGFGLRAMPRNCIFGHKGPAAFVEDNASNALLALLSLMNNKAFGLLVSLQLAAADAAARSYEVGVIKKTPLPILTSDQEKQLADLARRAWSVKRSLDTTEETSHAFFLPEALLTRQSHFVPSEIERKLAAIQKEIDEIAFDLYGFSEKDRLAALQGQKTDEHEKNDLEDGDGETVAPLDKDQIDSILSWSLGVIFGRFDIRLATGERSMPAEPEPFDPLPSISPGMLPENDDPFLKHCGILPEDVNHPNDLAHLVEKVLSHVKVEVSTDIQRWLQRDCFSQHLKTYSKSRRSAPIYWPLSTISEGYTLWVYYPKISGETLYTCVNDFVEPNLKNVSNDLKDLRSKSDRTTSEEKELTKFTDLEAELKDFRDELLRIAKFWKPNLNDGVQITASPLWKLFQHKTWQKKLKETWEKLEKGDYDWAHLAYSIWPERVTEKCRTDKSLAIAHDLEDLYEEPPEKPKKKRRKKAKQKDS
ncbi:conserved hypothetical protein [Desulfamplus magnetovallimortis]|uniref:site-specific DNA-methyltransferase (adenine-specific) n=1 Tax=Desulfamplus magnetovallimortis TaxID=1246637 RepID=A0A1W1H511_9BACT|nr:BREX-1 system adenine-specific DNA-methyltransferase PglX [Desulfamplus magnetovallimortis]SLM27561.1 conserved hypothetical protein [Desulfamplus magnetovallimortis]